MPSCTAKGYSLEASKEYKNYLIVEEALADANCLLSLVNDHIVISINDYNFIVELIEKPEAF